MKKLIVIFVLLSIAFFSAKGQNAIEIRLSPSWTYFRASSSYLSKRGLNNLYMMENPTIHLLGDVQLRYLIKDKWLLKSGIGVQAFGYKFEHISENELKVTLAYRYITASILGGYHFEKEKWSSEIILGLKPAYQFAATKRNNFINANNESVTNVQNLNLSKPFNWIATGEIQLNYAITQKIDIVIGTSTNLLLIPIEESLFYQKRYFSYQFNVGGIYYLHFGGIKK